MESKIQDGGGRGTARSLRRREMSPSRGRAPRPHRAGPAPAPPAPRPHLASRAAAGSQRPPPAPRPASRGRRRLPPPVPGSLTSSPRSLAARAAAASPPPVRRPDAAGSVGRHGKECPRRAEGHRRSPPRHLCCFHGTRGGRRRNPREKGVPAGCSRSGGTKARLRDGPPHAPRRDPCGAAGGSLRLRPLNRSRRRRRRSPAGAAPRQPAPPARTPGRLTRRGSPDRPRGAAAGGGLLPSAPTAPPGPPRRGGPAEASLFVVEMVSSEADTPRVRVGSLGVRRREGGRGMNPSVNGPFLEHLLGAGFP